MHEGDFIITPPMAWHDHGNDSAAPVFWLDGLDIPLVQFLDASFAESLDADQQQITRPIGDSNARYGANLLPVDQRGGGCSPVSIIPMHEPGRRWSACAGPSIGMSATG